MIAFIGADRINLLSDSFEFFVFTPYILLAIIFNLFIIVFCLNNLHFNWLSAPIVFLILYMVTTIISIPFSIDLYLSMKRFILLLFILTTFVLMLSYYSKSQLIRILIKSSVMGSFVIYLFNIILGINWFSFYEISSTFIDFKPDEIAYFVPRLGGYSSDVNRGTVILVFFTYVLLVFTNKNKLMKSLILLNSIFILFSFSRTVYLMLFMILLYKIFINTYDGRIRLLKYIISLLLLFGSCILLLHFYDYIDIELTIEERLDIFDVSRFSSSGIHLKLIYDGIITAFNDIKILLFGSGYGTSYKLIDGYYWSGSKYGNYHSMYITALVECGIGNIIALFFITFILPMFYKIKNLLIPFIFGLFFFNIFYQLNVEPLFWLIILLFYKISYELSYER